MPKEAIQVEAITQDGSLELQENRAPKREIQPSIECANQQQ
jgi:hypothetical protein